MVRQKPRGIQTTVLQAICGFTLHKGRAPLFFLNYFNSHHENIKFTSEKETNSKLFFLEIEISKDKDQFITSVYCKPTFRELFSNFDSFIPRSYKFNFNFLLLFYLLQYGTFPYREYAT